VDVSALRDNPIYFWLTTTFVSFVLGGLREELWRSAFLGGMRTLWPKCFSSRSGQIGAVVIAALFFGFGHLPQGGVAAGMAALLGLGLGVIMVLHRSIWPAVIAHGMFDATSLALLFWMAEHLKHPPLAIGH
jgi:membrane protease YdiL (CAAX protease family)